ncbi:hypothetical protein [Shouchella lehensis]|uniref:Uncharacterized protein n=1 Tax=Shouchella lehensis TaxID=300825 RepID=A0A4Y7WGD8_9BACI|nr:hypothetical protein [Shouchella lehensis]MBG9785241.1 hypothetical protein [Shouchella lehensis]RQW18967.1 hypothetical protein EH196_18625 [Bacillus sp. C1-1]TES46687.1 hypothetical protein E2L03_18560 [Shouchella lehensis]
MNKLVLVYKDEELTQPKEIWVGGEASDEENNTTFEAIAAEFDEYKVEAEEKNEPHITLKLEPVDGEEPHTYLRDITLKGEQQENVVHVLKKRVN